MRSSKLSILFILVIALAMRFIHIDYKSERPLQITTWDAFGYYLYLPSTFIYHDITQLDWLAEPDAKYGLSGGDLYQARMQDHGKRVFKYLSGTAILEMPFFLLGHGVAKLSNFPSDGFSLPYQAAIALAAIFYMVMALLLLRKVMLRYFEEWVVSQVLILIILATNALHYFAIDAGMSHGYIFFLYAAMLFVTQRWHESPKPRWAFLIGLVFGLALISRPTEIVMIFIPLLWNTGDKAIARRKWTVVKYNWKQLVILAVAVLIAVLPQIIYWKIATGSLFHAHGSRWDFFAPHWRVLFGWEKGWFIYTPITIFCIAGFFFAKGKAFFRPMLITGLASIWIVIAWHDWRYGGSYSTRALIQVYPLFALALGSIVYKLGRTKAMAWIIPIVAGWLVFVNLFQVWQYNRMIIHYDDMNRPYYASIFLDPNPEPEDMSKLDIPKQPRWPKDLANASYKLQSPIHLDTDSGEIFLRDYILDTHDREAIFIEADIDSKEGRWNSWILARMHTQDSVYEYKTRLHTPISIYQGSTRYRFAFPVHQESNDGLLELRVFADHRFVGICREMSVFMQ